MATCEECGAPLVDDRGCSYCEGTYCGAHQLPEHHDCSGVRGAERGGSGGDGDDGGDGGDEDDGGDGGDGDDGGDGGDEDDGSDGGEGNEPGAGDSHRG